MRVAKFYCVFWYWCGGLPSLEHDFSDLWHIPLTQLPNPQLLCHDLQDLQLLDPSPRFHFTLRPWTLINSIQILGMWNLTVWMKIAIHKVGHMHIWFDHMPIIKIHISPAATMRGMFCKFCPWGPLYICPRHLSVFLKWFILQNWKCYMVFSHLDAIFSIVFQKS